jgi:hypothetical protein
VTSTMTAIRMVQYDLDTARRIERRKIENEREGERILSIARERLKELKLMMGMLEDLITYPIGHPYLVEALPWLYTWESVLAFSERWALTRLDTPKDGTQTRT